MDAVLNKLKNKVSTVLPGNPLTREYEIGKLLGCAGPGMLWKLYAAKKKSTQQVCSSANKYRVRLISTKGGHSLGAGKKVPRSLSKISKRNSGRCDEAWGSRDDPNQASKNSLRSSNVRGITRQPCFCQRAIVHFAADCSLPFLFICG